MATKKEEAMKRLVDTLERMGIERVGAEGEILVKKSDQDRVANELEKAGFGLIVTSGKKDTGDDTSMFKVIVGPRSIKDIISLVVPESAEGIAQRIKVDPVLRSVQMNMIAFD